MDIVNKYLNFIITSYDMDGNYTYDEYYGVIDNLQDDTIQYIDNIVINNPNFTTILKAILTKIHFTLLDFRNEGERQIEVVNNIKSRLKEEGKTINDLMYREGKKQCCQYSWILRKYNSMYHIIDYISKISNVEVELTKLPDYNSVVNFNTDAKPSSNKTNPEIKPVEVNTNTEWLTLKELQIKYGKILPASVKDRAWRKKNNFPYRQEEYGHKVVFNDKEVKEWIDKRGK